MLTFPSKVDTWYVLLCALTIALPGGLAVRALVRGASPIVPLALLMASAGLPLWLLMTTTYVVTADTLRVRSGPIRITVPLRSVTRLRASRTPLSSPALSLDRIEVWYESTHVVISPRDRDGFVAAIAARVP